MNTALFYVQHLLGIGHAFRATHIARALANAGARVHLAWGGSVLRCLDLRGLEITFLEPLRVGAPFAALPSSVALGWMTATGRQRCSGSSLTRTADVRQAPEAG